jgi:hypothetical protein
MTTQVQRKLHGRHPSDLPLLTLIEGMRNLDLQLANHQHRVKVQCVTIRLGTGTVVVVGVIVTVDTLATSPKLPYLLGSVKASELTTPFSRTRGGLRQAFDALSPSAQSSPLRPSGGIDSETPGQPAISSAPSSQITAKMEMEDSCELDPTESVSTAHCGDTLNSPPKPGIVASVTEYSQGSLKTRFSDGAILIEPQSSGQLVAIDPSGAVVPPNEMPNFLREHVPILSYPKPGSPTPALIAFRTTRSSLTSSFPGIKP